MISCISKAHSAWMDTFVYSYMYKMDTGWLDKSFWHVVNNPRAFFPKEPKTQFAFSLHFKHLLSFGFMLQVWKLNLAYSASFVFLSLENRATVS